MASRGLSMHRLRPTVAVAFACLTTLGPVKNAAAQSAASSESTTLEAIVITATKRPTTVQTTPISITAVTGSQMASRGLTDLDSLITSVPSLAVRNSGVPGNDEFEIRGLNSQGGNTSMVGLYLGDIPLSAPATSEFGKIEIDPATYDLNRVEVLRGPQGTLYGSSSMGGTIRLIPNAPKLSSFEASTEEVVSDTVSGGSINHGENGMVNIPLGDTAAVRVVGSFTNASGWIQQRAIQDGAVSVDPGAYPDVSRPSDFYSAPLQESLSGINTTSVEQIRAEFLWQPIDHLKISPMAMYESTYAGGPDEIDVNGEPTHPQLPPVWAHWEIYPTPEPQTDRFSLGSLELVYDLPSISLTSATGLWHRNSIHTEDSTEEIASAIGIPVYDVAGGGIGPNASPFGPGIANQDYTRQLSEEFRVASTTPVHLPRGDVHWLLGYFYQDLYSESDQLLTAPEAGPVLGGTALFFNLQPQDIIQNAVFGHASWEITSHWKIAAGIRHYQYSLSQANSQWGLFGVIAVPPYTERYDTAASIGASGTIPSLTLTYQINDSDMIYANAAEGFRLGGASQPVPVLADSPENEAINPLEVSDECAIQAKVILTAACNPNLLLKVPSTFNSDTLWSYELGEKSSFFQRRMTVDVSGYYEHWLHPQIETAVSGFNVTVTGSDAAIAGLDLQVDALLPWGFQVLLNGGYTHAQFLFDSAITGYPAGTAIPDTPKVTASGVLSWLHNLSESLSLYGSVEADYTGDRSEVPLIVTATLQNIDQVMMTLPANCLTNLRFGVKGFRDNGDAWTASLFIDNLTNNWALLDPQPQMGLQTQAFTRFTMTQPLTAGIDVTYDFK
jgi:iron complex outermembrane recepter protein